ncbi:MAG: hypothetical protein V4622_11790 [Bacteroidota bacterium]
MKTIINSLSVATLLFTCNVLFAQCPVPEKIVRAKDKGAFGICSQSKSGALKVGEAYEMAFIAQANTDYRISAALVDEKAGNLVVELFEMESQKDASGNYKKVKKVISSVAQDELIEITTDKTRKMMIGVTIEGGEGNNKPQCIGVLILDKKTTIIGL